jgi:hypothetical protein
MLDACVGGRNVQPSDRSLLLINLSCPSLEDASACPRHSDILSERVEEARDDRRTTCGVYRQEVGHVLNVVELESAELS